ncbi:MAG TPA: hypothetical protein VI750_08875 [Pyrinomonadaceae bacterium]|nr:hypothetical protein [Pyrinomonadaceae bacterium]HLE63239.1 hypothetical protein [Pyrinomonadaceae bacterium]
MKKNHRFVVCIQNSGYEASLELFKIYLAIPDDDPESHGYLRVVDEDGEDYWYPSDWFYPVDLPRPLERALLSSNK